MWRSAANAQKSASVTSFERPSSTKDPTNEFEWSQATIEAATMQLRDVTVRSYRGWREEDGLSRV